MERNMYSYEYLRMSANALERQAKFTHSNHNIMKHCYNQSINDNPLNPNMQHHHYTYNPNNAVGQTNGSNMNNPHNMSSTTATLSQQGANNPYKDRLFKNPPVINTWRLNERHYGALVGLSKSQAELKLGKEAVMGWRRSW
jgi:hypothetical protein